MKKFLFLLLPLILYCLLSAKLIYKDPPIWPDEVYFVNMAENYNRTGHLFVSLYGVKAADQLHVRSYNYPPLYIYTLASWIRVFGSSLENIRLLSFILGTVSLVIFFYISLSVTRSWIISMLSTTGLVLSPPFGMATHIARMEILVFLFFLLSLLALMKQKFPLSAGFAALACLTHPIGILTYGILGLCIRKRLHIFFLAVSFGVAGWWWWWQIRDHLDLFLIQTLALVTYKTTREPLLNLLFQNDVRWRMLLLFYLLLGCMGCIKGYLQKKPFILFCSLGMFITFILTIKGIDQWYFIFLPVFPLLLASTSKRLFYIPLILLIILHGVISLPANVNSIKRNENYFTFSNGIMKELPDDKKIVISSIPDPYFVLRKRQDLTLFHMPTLGTEQEITAYLADKDIIIYNYALNSTVLPYIAKHTKKKVTVVQEDGYQAEIIFLR